MELVDVGWTGPEIDDTDTLARLPAELRALLEQINGWTQFYGGLHVRGACIAPDWHSLRVVWTGEHALHLHYPVLSPTDIPFAQDVFGDQLILRDGFVYRLAGETGELEPLNVNLVGFLEAAQAGSRDYLNLRPLMRWYNSGNPILQPGQLLNVYPPFCTKEAANGVSFGTVPALERIGFLADFAAQIANLPEGAHVKMNVTEPSISPTGNASS